MTLPDVKPVDVVRDGTLSLLIHSPSKVGKSTFGSTAPPPILVLDVEGSWRFIRTAGYRTGVPLRRIAWDPNTGPPPRADGTWEFCHVTVRDWRTLVAAYQWLIQADHDFRSLVFDSISEAQRRLKENLRGIEQMRMADWGDLLVQMDRLIRSFRDLVLVPGIDMQVVVFIAETRLLDGKWRPYMQGQIGTALPYWMDIVGYLFTDTEADENGQHVVRVKRLLIGDNAEFESGERVQGALGDVVTRPHIGEMLNTIFGGPAVAMR